MDAFGRNAPICSDMVDGHPNYIHTHDILIKYKQRSNSIEQFLRPSVMSSYWRRSRQMHLDFSWYAVTAGQSDPWNVSDKSVRRAADLFIARSVVLVVYSYCTDRVASDYLLFLIAHFFKVVDCGHRSVPFGLQP